MKSLLITIFSLWASMSVFTACDDAEDPIKGFTLSTEEITLGAEGGTQTVNVATEAKWVAKTSEPWLQILPANGIGTVECKILVDSTLRNDVRSATITFAPEGEAPRQLEVYQTGFGKMIGLSIKEVEVPNMERSDKRYFDVAVTTNVVFDVKVETDAAQQDWLTKPKNFKVDLEAGARPRTTKLRFTWKMNTNPEERLASINFFPVSAEDAEAKETILKVVQKASPKIEDNRQGDSLALVIIQEKMNGMTSWDTSEKMEYWKGIKLWEKKDKEVQENPEMLGRVRVAEIRMFVTEEPIPDEIAKLTYVETLVIASNGNKHLYSLSTGTPICQLKHVKSLTIYSYGLTELPNDFKNLGATLEELDLSNNNFNMIPNMLTSANFPKLKSLNLTGQRRSTVTDLPSDSDVGLKLMTTSSTFTNLLKWEKLERLRLSYNLIYGQLPASIYGIPTYTKEEVLANDTLATAKDKLVGLPKVLPNCRDFSINLNFISGTLPNWLLYHPNLGLWNPFTMIFTQEAGYDFNGKVPTFTNVPANLNYYYELYPLRKPQTIE